MISYYVPVDIDANLLSRAGITFEFVGALFIAPEVIDRLIGFKRIEDASERLIEYSASFVRRILTSGGEHPSAAPIIIWIVWTYYSVFAAAAVVAIGAGGWLNPMWWLTGNGLILLPALLEIALLAVSWLAVSALLLRRGSLGAVLMIPIWPIAFLLLILATPILMAVEFLVSRLQDGWISTAFLLVGLPLVLVGLALQFASTF